MTTESRWTELDMSGLINRLEQARTLLEQAAALTAADDAGRVAAVTELQRRLAEERHDNPNRRRHR